MVWKVEVIVCVGVWDACLRFQIFIFFVNSNLTYLLFREQKSLFIVYSTVYVLKNIKNGFHGIIHTFKNYFITILSVFSFSNNKFNPNGPTMWNKIN